MLSRPRRGETIQIWYRAGLRDLLHGTIGVVEAAATGRGPRNHTVRVAGVRHSIPGGQLRRPVHEVRIAAPKPLRISSATRSRRRPRGPARPGPSG